MASEFFDGFPTVARNSITGGPARRYANSLGSAGLDRLARAAIANPAALGRWGPYLAAAAQRGPDALAVTHFALSQAGDGDYSARARLAMNARDGDQ